MNGIEQLLLDHLLHDPVVQGMALKALADAAKGLFANLDRSGVLQKEGWLTPLSTVVTLLATGLNLALTGHLQDLDLSTLGTLLLSFVGVKAVSNSSVLPNAKPKQ